MAVPFDFSGSTLPLSRTSVMAESATCWPKAMFSGLPTAVAMVLKIDRAGIVQAQRRLYFQDLKHRMVQPLPGNLARCDCLDHRLVRSAKVGRNQQQIVSRLERLDRGAANIVGEKMRQPSHVESVGDDQSFESKLLFEQI